MSDSAAAITVRNMSTVGASGPPRRLLSLDGGGVKGMAILLILKRLFRTIQRDEHLPEMPRPCDYFDLIGGTSTGGIIAIMLGRLRMSIDDCIQVFRHISETVFKQNPSWFARVRGALLTGQPFFEAGRLEEAIRDVLTARGFGEDDKLYEADNSNCKVFVSTTRARTVHAVLLRSYITSKPSEENYNCTIWEAARATSAAPLFFEPTQLSSDVSQATFVDGALHLNNPIAKVINEAEYIWPTAAFKSIVSIGTGWIRVTGLNNSNLRLHHVVQTCVDLALNCHNEAEKFVGDRKGKELSEAGVYHRFDVDWGMDSVALDNWHKMDDIDAFTQEYLGRQESELEKCSRSLCTEELAPQDIQISEFISTLPRHSSTSNSNRIFSGRETELSNIRTLMESSPRTHQSVCLHGLGGIGKSQIAYEFARRCCEERSVFWIKANDFENAELGYLAVAEIIIPQFNPVASNKIQTFEVVKAHLETQYTRPWLFVLDDAEDLKFLLGDPIRPDSDSFRLMDYIPFAAHGQVLITTRQSKLVGEGIVPPQNGIRVGEMTVEDGLLLLEKCIPPALTSQSPKAMCREFLDMLGGLPLAIVQAASYMREEQCPMEVFIALYKDLDNHDELFKRKATSVDKESKSQPAMILDLLGFLDSQSSTLRGLSEGEYVFRDQDGPTPIDNIENLFPLQECPATLLSEVYSNHLKRKPSHHLQLSIGPLCNYSLVTSRECWVHPVVHSWISRRLPIEERHKYVTWLAKHLLSKIAIADKGPQDDWEDIVLGAEVRKLVMDELMPQRHALVVKGHAFSNAMTEYMRARQLPSLDFAELLYQVGRMLASAGKTERAIKYLERSISAMQDDMNHCPRGLIAEKKVFLSKVRSRTMPPAEATLEAETCAQDFASLHATVWWAECLRKEGRLDESLQLFRNIMDAYSIDRVQNFQRYKETFAATVGAVFVLAAKGDVESKAEARRIIDHSIAPFIRGMPRGHMLKTILYPGLLIRRVEVAESEVADGGNDQVKALDEMVMHDATYLSSSLAGGYPDTWRTRIDDLRLENKRDVIEHVAQKYVESRLPILDIMKTSVRISSTDASDKLHALWSEVDDWCSIYNHLGRAYSERQAYEQAEKAHGIALALWLFLYPQGRQSADFRSNLWGLDRALLYQRSPSAEAKRRDLECSFSELFEQERLARLTRRRH